MARLRLLPSGTTAALSVVVTCVAAALALAPAAVSSRQVNRGVVLNSDLFGFLEVINGVYGLGDNNATGSATLTISRKGKYHYGIKYHFTTLNLANANAPSKTHIHFSPAGQNGTLLVAFPSTKWRLVKNAPVRKLVLSGAIKSTAKRVGENGQSLSAIIRAVLRTPLNYYVNLHTPTYPNGAIRGQLYK